MSTKVGNTKQPTESKEPTKKTKTGSNKTSNTKVTTKTTNKIPVRKTPLTKDTPLTPKEQAFIEEYIIDHNGQEAAKRAGYRCKNDNTARAIASRLLIKVNVLYQLNQLRQERKKTHIATAEEVMRYFTQVMNGEIKDQFGLDASLRDRNDAGKELAKRTIDIENRLKGIADQKVDNEVKIVLDWGRK